MNEEKDVRIDLEANLKKLEEIVDKLESEKVDLDESIKLFEKGIKLAEEIKGELSEAELKLKKVVEESELDFTTEDFDL